MTEATAPKSNERVSKVRHKDGRTSDVKVRLDGPAKLTRKQKDEATKAALEQAYRRSAK